MINKDIDYKKLKDTRVDNDIKQKEIAAKLNITPSAYSRIERGERGLRVEQLKAISEMLGKDINVFLKKNMNENNRDFENPESLKEEITFLKSMLKLVSTNVEAELFETFHRYDAQYPMQILSFEDYLKDHHTNPDYAEVQIKKDVEDYLENKIYPGYYNEVYGKNGIEIFINKNDEWIKQFVRKEENYHIIFEVIGTPYHINPQNSLLSFKDMLRENPLIHRLFQYGFLENSWFNFLWQQYLEEMKSSLTGDGTYPIYIYPMKDGHPDFMSGKRTLDSETNNRERQEREAIRVKMAEILKV